MEKLSIILLAYRRHDLTVRNFTEMMKSTRIPDEVIVVNDSGDPMLREMLLALKPFPTKVIYARVNEDINWNYVGASNLGFWLSTGDYFILQDTDHIPNRTCYEEGVKILNERPEISRIAYYRNCVDVVGVMNTPMEEWKAIKFWGSNQMVTMMRRDIYLRTKGQDERYAGNYGWSTYSWVNKYKNLLKVQSAMASSFWAVIGDGGEPGMVRGLSPINYRIHRNSAKKEEVQSPTGILNFTYTVEYL